MKEHVAIGITHFNITTDSYEPGMVPSDDVTILSAEYTPYNRYLRMYIPVHAGESWALADYVIKVALNYKDKNPDAVASYRFSKLEDWEGPNSLHSGGPDPNPGYCTLRKCCHVSIWFSGTVEAAESHVEAFRAFLTDSLKEFHPIGPFSFCFEKEE